MKCLGRFRDGLLLARARSASDLHLSAGNPPMLRIDGELESVHEPALLPREIEEIARSLTAPRDLSAAMASGDCTISLVDSEAGSVRVHLYRETRGVALAARILNADVPDLLRLGLPHIVEELAERDRGIIFIGGATGSGKSTTLAAIVERINARRCRRIVTIEDPIEYVHQSKRSLITQREIGIDTAGFESALPGLLRSDPDVIVLGELRNTEAVRAALTAADTGHLVLTTIHSGDATQIVDRIVDCFSGALASYVRSQLAQSLAAIVCQQLVRRSERAGRLPIVEILVATDAVRNLVRDAKQHQLRNAMATGREHGMQTFEQHALALFRAGEIAEADVQGFGAIRERMPA